MSQEGFIQKICKPVKHRRIRLMKQWVVDMSRNGKRWIIYHTLNTLSKMGILFEKTDYSDSIYTNPVDLGFIYARNNFLEVSIHCSGCVRTFIHQIYFSRKGKGNRVYNHLLYSEDYSDLNFSVEDVYILIDKDGKRERTYVDKRIYVDKRFKNYKLIRVDNIGAEKPREEIIEFNLSKVYDLKFKISLDGNCFSTTEVFETQKELAKEEFNKALERISFNEVAKITSERR